MSPRSKEQFASLRQRSRGAILKAALHLFARKGYRETTMDDIAAGAGVSKGLIYNHFGSKIEILESIMVDAVRHRLPMLTETPIARDQTFRIETLIRAWIQFIKTEPELVRLFQQIHTSGHLSKVLTRKHGRLYEDLMKSVTELFEQHHSSNPFLDAVLLGSIMDGVSLNYTAAPDHFPMDKLEERLVALFAYQKH